MKYIIYTFFALLFSQATDQINKDHLKVGELAPSIEGIDQNGKQIDSKEILKKDKILLVFYRGNWCPHCKKHLGELEKQLEDLKQKGVFVVVVTPESQEKTRETQEKFDTSFSIVHDEGNKIMTDYKVLFEVNEQTVPRYYERVSELVFEYNGSNQVLPVPATYLIGRDGKIEYVHYDPDYTKRSNIEEVVSGLN